MPKLIEPVVLAPAVPVLLLGTEALLLLDGAVPASGYVKEVCAFGNFFDEAQLPLKKSPLPAEKVAAEELADAAPKMHIDVIESKLDCDPLKADTGAGTYTAEAAPKMLIDALLTLEELLPLEEPVLHVGGTARDVLLRLTTTLPELIAPAVPVLLLEAEAPLLLDGAVLLLGAEAPLLLDGAVLASECVKKVPASVLAVQTGDTPSYNEARRGAEWPLTSPMGLRGVAQQEVAADRYAPRSVQVQGERAHLHGAVRSARHGCYGWLSRSHLPDEGNGHRGRLLLALHHRHAGRRHHLRRRAWRDSGRLLRDKIAHERKVTHR